jgi:hypothetical protein
MKTNRLALGAGTASTIKTPRATQCATGTYNVARSVLVLAAVHSALNLFHPTQVSAGEIVKDEGRGFTLTLPDGFKASPEVLRNTPGMAYVFVYGDPAEGQPIIVLFVEELRYTIGRERLTVKDMPPDFQGRIFRAHWQGFEVDGFEVPEQLGDIKTITYNVQIPLKRAAIQIKLFGPADLGSELQVMLSKILDGIHGESNWVWLPWPVSVAVSQHYGTVLAGFAIVFVLGGLVILWLLSRKARKGTVLAVAVVIYLAGSGTYGARTRETKVLTGAMKLLGFTGGILGGLDLVRKRKSVIKPVADETMAPSGKE